MRSQDDEYGLLDVIAVLRRVWVILVVLPAIAAAALGYWAYKTDSGRENRLIVTSVISLPATDRPIIDFQQQLQVTAAGFDTGDRAAADATLTAIDLPSSTGDGLNNVSLSISFKPGVDGSRLMQALLASIGNTVRERHYDPELLARIDLLETRQARLNALWEDLTKRPPASSDSTLSNEALTLSSLSIAVSLLGADLTVAKASATQALTILGQPGEPVPAEKSMRWTRLPIAAFIGTALFILFATFTIDSIRLAMRRRTA